ncbi:MAG: Flp pilus assembly protein CpaB [Proteobacteria bacterium]|nr:Flp pilus assembly protein CpaB [Pseudomonadota bacterium]
MKRFAFIRDAVRERPAAAAVVAGLAAALLASAYLARREGEISRAAEPAPVVIAARDIPPGETIDRAALRRSSVPAIFVQPGAIGEISEAEGRVAMVPLRKGSQLTRSAARRADHATGVAPLLASGMRAFSVSLPRSRAAGGLVGPGDRVDLIATFDLGTGSSPEITTMALVTDARVVAVERRVAGSPEREAGADAGKGLFGGAIAQGQLSREVSVTLAVSPAQAQAIAFAQESGSIALAVRPPYEGESNEPPAPTTISSIAEGAGGVVPLRRPFKEYRGAR